MDMKEVIVQWNCVCEKFSVADLRREKVLNKIKCKADDAWGKGCLIFCPIKHNDTSSLKCRFLPKLEYDLPIKSMFLQKNTTTMFSKHNINNHIVDAVKAWHDLQPFEEYIDCEYIKLIDYICDNFKCNDYITTETFKNSIFQENTHFQLSEKLRMAESSDMLKYGLVGKKRRRYWKVQNACIF